MSPGYKRALAKALKEDQELSSEREPLQVPSNCRMRPTAIPRVGEGYQMIDSPWEWDLPRM